MFLTNVVIAWLTIEILRAVGRKQRRIEETLQPAAEAVAHH
jgi:hypothetical protein